MPELFIGNVSKQIIQFAYRTLERAGVIYQTIAIGGQIRIAPNGVKTDLTTPEIDYIIGQHRVYGILPIEELNDITASSSVCYAIGKPISADKLQRAMRKPLQH